MLPDHIRLYWRVRAKLRLVDMVPMLDNRTVVPLNLRGLPVLGVRGQIHGLAWGLSGRHRV